jgi:hypothetical protein
VNQSGPDRNLESEAFYGGAHYRIVRNMLAIGATAVLLSLMTGGWRSSLGILVGCIVAGLNFYWLARFVNALAARAVETGSRDSGLGPILRYGLMGLIAYAIFKSSVVSFPSFLLGLFLPVPAILVEAAQETYVALRRGL